MNDRRDTPRDASDEELVAFIRKTTLPKVCADANMRDLIDNYGITYRYSYLFSNSSTPVDVDIDSAACSGGEIKGVEEGVANWFGDYKPYNSFASKIRGAYVHYELIDDETHSDLLVIKEIRNAFAHTRERLDFKAPQIKELAERFGGHTKDVDVRRLFDERVSRVVTAIQTKMDQIIFDEATVR